MSNFRLVDNYGEMLVELDVTIAVAPETVMKHFKELQRLVFERGSETARFVVEDDPRLIDPLPTPDWEPTLE